MVDAGYYQDLLRPIFKGRRVVITGAPLAGATDPVRRLRALGVERSLVVAAGPGTGEFPSTEDADWIILERRSVDIVAEIHDVETVMAHPPGNVIEAIDRFDPDRQAIVLAPTVAIGPIPNEMAGRRVWGRRSQASLALEDKSRIDAFWDRVGVTRAPSIIAPVSLDALTGAHRRLDRGSGTVMAGDARDGLHGGAHLVRWVRVDTDLTAALELFGQHCDFVRVMPFLEGIPCSIHGIVFPDRVVAARPVEMVSIRPASGFKFLYAGAATYWDPPDRDRDYMRSLAIEAGAGFREVAGLGTFTIDGVMSEDGFLPTEMNPRFGGGLNVMARVLGDAPIGLICQALQEGEPLEYRSADFEELLLTGADSHRGGGGWTVINKVETESHEHPVIADGAAYRLAQPDEAPDGTLLIGPSNVGGFVRFTPVPERTPNGPSLAPRVVSAFALADEAFATGLGPLAPARDVRR